MKEEREKLFSIYRLGPPELPPFYRFSPEIRFCPEKETSMNRVRR